MSSEEAEFVEAEARYLEIAAEQMLQHARDVREAFKSRREAILTEKLESLPFRIATSGKCEWIDAAQVPEEVRTLFNDKGEFVTAKHHFVTTKDRNILCFKRKEGEAAK